MIAPYLALVGGPRGAIVAVVAFVLGAGAMRLDVQLHLLPSVRAEARAEERARIAEEVAREIGRSTGQARQIEREIRNETDESLRCILDPRSCGVR